MPLFTTAHTVESKRIYEGRIINFRVDKLRIATGQEVTREVVEHNGGVTIACQPAPGQVVLIKQYRYSIDQELLELPAGRIEEGEDPMLAAQRELTEETGYQARNWSELVRMYTAPGFCNEMLYVYKATDVIEVGKDLDEDEETEVIVMSVEEAWALVMAGKVQDSKTIAGVGMLFGMQRS